jgi:uncharacterized protein (TIGR03437 family)
MASQAALLMPSSTPVGGGAITVTFNGQTSAPAPVQVTAANFGIFTLNQAGTGPAVVTDANYVPVTLVHSATPGQVLVLWGTGLGRIAADESAAPPVGNVGLKPTVWVGAQPATVLYWGRSPCCAGLDQINFQVPAGVSGCYVPVALQIGNTVSNFGSISVDSSGRACSDPDRLSAAQLSLIQNGQNLNVAALSLSRSITTMSLPPPAASTTTTLDSGGATFLRYTPAQLMSSQFGQAVSVGACSVFPVNVNSTVADPVQPLGLDAGPSLVVGGTNGSVTLPAVQKGYYNAILGSSTTGRLFLDIPMHTVNVLGGADVGVWGQELQMPPSLSWTNQSSISTISETQGATVSWTNAVPNGYVTVTGYSFAQDQNGNAGAGARFYCTTPSGPNGTGQFAIPPYVLLSLLLSGSNSSNPTGFLGIESSLAPSDPLPAERGIDAGFAHASVQLIQNVAYTQ